MELIEYRNELINDVSSDAIVDGIYEDQAFCQKIKDFLVDWGNVTDLLDCFYVRNARDNKYKSMAVDMYNIEGADNSLNLLICDYDSNIEVIGKINTEDLNRKIKSMVGFVENVIKEFFIKENIEKSSRVYELAMDILLKLRNKEIDRVHLFYATDNLLGEKTKLKDIEPIEFNGRRISVDVTTYDIQDIMRAEMSLNSVEPITIETKEFNCSGIPCLKADLGDEKNYSAYLAIVPGEFLAGIYRKYGGKLLESNVRAFLNLNGKVNKGIRNTILNEETKFFTYNNGIACTAEEIKLDETNSKIISLKNFQIVNGGQTTASLANAIVKDDALEHVKKIYVAMKLTILNEPDDILVGDIAKYANSQNKVSATDLLSNNSFYVELEKMSRKIMTPKSYTKNYQTYWYFERSRGQYNRDLAQLTKKSEKDKFKNLNPKDQMFKKPDIAKFMNSYEQEPYNVAWGAEVNATKFQEKIDKRYNDISEINEGFFKNLISKGILFKEARLITLNTEWYKENNGILAQVTPYIVSKLIYEIERYDSNKFINLNKIWDTQSISEATREEIKRIGEVVWTVISDPNRGKTNIAEWCKRPACWENVKNAKFTLSKELIDELVTKSELEVDKAMYKKEKRTDDNINFAVEIFNRGAKYWQDLLTRARNEGCISEKEMSLLNAAARSCTTFKLVSDAQSRAIRKIVNDLEKRGVYIERK